MRCAARGSKNSAPISPSTRAIPPGPMPCSRQPMARASISSSIRSRRASPNQKLKAAAVKGRIVNVGRLGGTKGPFDFDLHALKRIQYIGVTFRTRSLAEVREITRRLKADLWGAVEARQLRLPIYHAFPLAEAAAA